MLIAATAALLLPMSASAARAESFTHDGVTYVYKVVDRGSGKTITGKTSKSDRFQLLVRNGRVTGHVAGRPVAFRTKEAQIVPPIDIAAR